MNERMMPRPIESGAELDGRFVVGMRRKWLVGGQCRRSSLCKGEGIERWKQTMCDQKIDRIMQ